MSEISEWLVEDDTAAEVVGRVLRNVGHSLSRSTSSYPCVQRPVVLNKNDNIRERNILLQFAEQCKYFRKMYVCLFAQK